MLDTHRTQLQIALGAHRAGRVDEAKRIYTQLYALYPRVFDVAHLLGLAEFQSGQLERGAALLCEALAVNPRSAAAHNNLGNIRKAQGRFPDAAESYGRALALKPDYPEALVNRGSARLALGRFAEALADYDGALKMVPGSPDARLGRGLALKELKRLPESLAAFDSVLAVRPQDAEALSNKANLLLDLGRTEEAAVALRNAARLRPAAPGIHFNLGNATLALGQAAEALNHYDKVISLSPGYAKAYGNRGNALARLGRLPEAVASYDKAISLKPDDAEAHNNRGNALKELGRLQEALASYETAIGVNAGYAEAHSNRGIALKDLHRPDEALTAFDRAIALKPEFAEAHSNRANVLADLGRLEEALASYSLAISLKPGHAEIYCNRGNALKELNRLDEALAEYERAISLKPEYAEAHSNRGNALAELMRLEEAVASYDEAIRLKPDYGEAHANRGNALKELRRLDEALASYDMAFSLKPDIDFLAGNRLYTKMKICDWAGLDDGLAAVEEALRHGKKVIDPWIGLNLLDDPALQLAAAQIYTVAKYPPLASAAEIPRSPGTGKIRVGYYSSDFGEHAVSFLMAEVFESHDRQHFDVQAFSYGPGRSGAMRDRIRSACGGFHDVNRHSDDEVVALSRQLGIDIAVNLNGYTDHQRTGLFQKRCAPIQVNYLGYPGTMGASYMDYIIADHVLVPEREQPHYAEKIVYLPGSFQANDSQRRISDRVFTRAECGLPGTGFVFCCFNNTYKITPTVFAAWMRILARVPGSVLWLYAENRLAIANLKAEAVARGVDPSRLVFAEKVNPQDYLARYRLADLFLDTLPYNAGTTASDALWAGLPLLTCCGRTFAGRMAASLLTAVDLPELVTSNLQDYEERAVALAREPERLQAIRQRLARNRVSSSLFDGKAFARSVEAAFKQMAERHRQGLPAAHFPVS
jgi:predicted O-linked N-acetylglucosamine transferase (SPINDLY family)